MPNKLIKTRIKNRIDSLANWQVEGVSLLPGEIAIVSVTTQTKDDQGNIIEVPAVLMKVGESDGSGGTKAFSALPWLSAKAADVYEWAKTSDIKDVKVKVIVDEDTVEDKLGDWLKTLNDRSLANAEVIENLQDVIAGGIHFVGIAKADTNFAKTATATETVTISIKDGTSYKSYTLVLGDIVIKENTTQEYIWTGTAWQELGDQTRIGALENKVSGLDVDPTVPTSGTKTATSFISSIKKDSTSGKLVATKHELPVAVDKNTTKGIVALGVTGGAASYDDVFGNTGLEPRVASIADNYVKFIANSDTTKPGTLSIGEDSTASDYIIFDCGGASI
jgi:hypothetical protein